MRILVFFDLPVKTKVQRRDYQRFRTFLLDDGYAMLQYSVYSRICNGYEAVDKHLARLQKQIPQRGSVRAMSVTEKQYAKMKIILGTPTPQEKRILATQLTLF